MKKYILFTCLNVKLIIIFLDFTRTINTKIIIPLLKHWQLQLNLKKHTIYLREFPNFKIRT